MKRFSDLEHAEILALSEEDIKKYIEIEVAFAGIMPVPLPKKTTLEDVNIKKSDQYFQVHGILFKTEKDAAAFAEMEVYQENYDWSISSDYRFAVRRDNCAVVAVSLYEKADIYRLKSVLQDNKRKKEETEKEERAFDKYNEAVSSIRNSIWGLVAEAKDKQREIDSAQEAYNKYLELSEGNEEIAKNFFRNAYKGKPELIEAILNEK